MRFRYYFEPGSGNCLWPDDEEAIQTYDYTVELEDLPLSEETIAMGRQVMNRFDNAQDWTHFTNPLAYSEEEKRGIKDDSDRFFARVVAELGPGYEIINEAVIYTTY